MVCCFVLLFIVPSFAQATAEDQPYGSPVASGTVLLDGQRVPLRGTPLVTLKNTFSNHDFSTLPYASRLDLYEQSKVSITWPVFKNLIFGFGKGSQIQNDISSELFGIITDLSGFSISGSGFGLFIVDMLFIFPFYATGNESYSIDSSDPFAAISLYSMLIGGGGTVVLGRIVQTILPITYGNRYNRILRQGLHLTKDLEDTMTLEFSIKPKLIINHDLRMGMQFVGTINL